MVALLGIIIGIILAVLVVGVPMLYSMMSYGIVVKTAWMWFVVPLGLAPISGAHAAGLAVLIGLLTTDYNQNAMKEDKKTEYFASIVLRPWVVLGIMYLVHMWM